MRFSVGAKLLSGFSLVIALSAVIGIVAINNLAALNEVTTQVYAKELTAVARVNQAREAAQEFRLQTTLLVHETDPVERERRLSLRRESDAAISRELSLLKDILYTAEGRMLLSQVETAWNEYRPVADQVVAASAAGNVAEAQQLDLTTARDRYRSVDGLLDQVSALKDNLAAEGARNAQLTYERTRSLTLGLLAVTLFVGVGAAFWLGRAIGDGLRATSRTASLIAEGDLTHTVSVRSKDEIGDLAEAFNRMVRGLRELTGEIAQGLAAASSEILAAISQQGASATEQAAAVSQTTATVDEVRVAAQQATEKAQSVAAMAQHAADVANEGLQTVERAVAGMENVRGRVESIAEQILSLSEQTQQIGEIIATVDDLSDQSNLLAVNAAIEASRAGEQGRGFAVVAQEVRRLAERSKTATVEVRTILTDIQRATNAAVMATEQGTKGTEEGVRLVEQAGLAIRQLASTIRESAAAAQQIRASVGQQGVGMDQIAMAMANINQATTETAAGTRQLQKAAENMNEMAQRLLNLASRYKRGDWASEGDRDAGRPRSGRAAGDISDGAGGSLPGAHPRLPVAREGA